MSGKDRIIIVCCGLLAIMLMTAGTYVMPEINQQRRDLQLTYSANVNRNLPPQIAFTQAALGSFRGLAVDVLWARATQLKQDGKYYEAMQLSDWITKLQPRFPQVWAFHAWNMAYNISVATHTPRERWMWVQAGIRLLRDEGIPLNPNSPRLYKELSWILLHKVGQFSDEMHFYYKPQLAYEWHGILGAPPEGTTEDVLNWFKPIADADAAITEAEADGTKLVDPIKLIVDQDSDVAAQVVALTEMGFEIDQELLRGINDLISRGSMLKLLKDPPKDLPEKAKKLYAWINDPDIEEPRKQLIHYLTAAVIRNDYHMSCTYMYELMEQFGPMDWRHCAAHGTYWAALGVQKSQTLMNKDKFDVLNTDRQVVHGLQQLTHNGRVVFDYLTGQYGQLPDPRFIGAYEYAAFDALSRLDQEALTEAGSADVPTSFQAGHENFLIWAIKLCYFYGDRATAESYYGKLRDKYSDKDHNKRIKDRYTRTLDEFVLSEDIEDMKSLSEAGAVVSGLVRQGIYQGLSNGRARVAAQFLGQARKVYGWYGRNFAEYGTAESVQAGRRRMDLPPFEQMVSDAYYQFLTETNVHPMLKIKAWNAAPDWMKRPVYDRVLPMFTELIKDSNLDMNAAFPEPEGMEAYRKQNKVENPTKPKAAETDTGKETPLKGTTDTN